jgi:tetratricopeptide (TPR) repeat protein
MPPRLDALQRCLCPVLTRSLRIVPRARRIVAPHARTLTTSSTRFSESPGAQGSEFTSVADISTPEALDALTSSIQATTAIHNGANDPHSPAFKHLLTLVDSLRSNFISELDIYISNGTIIPDIVLYNRFFIELTKKDDHLAPLAWALFDHMKGQKIQPNIETYLAMLKMLENSPDYIRRQEILGEMRLKWYTLTDAAWCWVIKGYLNDYQVEIAMKMVEERLEQGGVIDKGVYYRMAEQLIFLGETKEALKWTEVMWNLAEGRGVRKLWWDLLAKASEEGDVSHFPFLLHNPPR